MDVVTYILFAIGLILFFGYFAGFISSVTYIVIFGTIFLSSVRIFIYKYKEGDKIATNNN
jgi:hypothetical protein